ncbi:DEHA2D03190p [Debaryomyces hansenii CBS767]|uniref:Glucoamylase 1 n=1 Tax=Debaryomyces hansenii (strain ATCC 36239 / CBS 767 / BCRC 21394 / JCM 1990 / NBRC 0083 / IGC 2968) TaxID=284592 RepID=Q6BT64_DEBHA|nr:DEHA2D03190p [Debaryomyces hansenii CBS767]CAG86741.2 DEHA2D03190p [Debaryomyces hansenii CBS767]|eukprot:XP_458606.2 DEHA2D03190p [Debaryomyces hansenii CBS767]
MHLSTFVNFIGLGLISTVCGSPIATESNSNKASSTFDESSRATISDEMTWGVAQTPNILNDTAVDANAVAKGYDLVNVSQTAHGLAGILKLNEATNIYGYDFDCLNLLVEYQADSRLHVHIEPANLTDVFVLPEDLIAKPRIESNNVTFDTSDLVFKYQEKNFGFSVIRSSTGEVLFSTIGNPLVYSNQFIQFNTTLPKDHVVTGLGESIHGSINEPGVVKTLFANDVGDPIDGNIYGVHPVYMDHRYDSNTAHSVYWRTSAIQEVVVEEEALTWRALSGVVDLYFFSGPEPKDVIKQYVHEIGLPALQPYWALGYHQCRWGYDTIEELEEVVSNFKKFDIPLETIWSDIDYMDGYKDFTTDPHRYPLDKFKKFIDDIHGTDQHYIPMFDAGIYVPNPNNASDIYEIFHNGNESDSFLKNPDGSLYIGSVWPGFTAFPDFLAPKSQEFWTKTIKDFYDKVQFDGLWCDMNEASSFCVGSCGSEGYLQNPAKPNFEYGDVSDTYPKGFEQSNASEYSSIQQKASSTSSAASSSTSISDSQNTIAPGKGNINYPPYAINHAQGDHDLATHAISPNATHYDGTIEYDVHNLYGYMEVNATYNALLEAIPNKRPFILSRATFAGSGKHAAHWGGDNTADWAWMYFSIPQALSMGMSGIPFFGVDVCGFNSNTDSELCSRWMQLGSFFPFYRNHNTLGAISQEPYVWSSVTDATKITMNIRYLLLPYYYSLLHESHESGLPVLRALSWEFPNQRNLSTVDTQFFVGDALLVTPVLEPSVETVKGVFPGSGITEIYYDWYTHEQVDFQAGKNETLEAPLGHIPLHIRGGNILPTQEPGYTIAQSRKNPFGLIVALDKNGGASGKLYLDDGESQEVESSLFVNFVALNNTIVSSPYGDYKISEPLSNITILGVNEKPDSVTFEGKDVTYTYENSTLFVTDLNKDSKDGAFDKQFTLKW